MGPNKFLHGQKLERFHLASTRDRRNWTNIWTAKCASLGPEKSRSQTCTLKPRPNDRNLPTQHIATLLGATCCVRLATVLQCVATCWMLLAQTFANNTQHVATRWPNARNMLRPTMLRCVALASCDRLAGALAVQILVQFRWSRVNARWNRASFCPCKNLFGPV